MVIQKLTWWLWNQMFQYAYIKSLSLRNWIDFKLDISEYQVYFRPFELEIFNIEKKYCLTKEIPFFERFKFNNRYLNVILHKSFWMINKNHIYEKSLKFDKKFLWIKKWYIEWFFQSEKYFKDYENEIRSDFYFVKEISHKNKEILDIINSTNSVSIHVRRWDYISNKLANKTHGVCDLEYYTTSIKFINSKISDSVFFFFSDDIEWVKQNIKITNKSYYIDWNTWEDSFEDMRLMSNCKHNIIANSSFSWWWAWLNKNNSPIVIAPKKWFNNNLLDPIDILKEGWQKF